MNTRKSLDKLVNELKERAKELNCLYKVQELLNDRKKTVDDVLRGIIEVLPPGWQYPEICQAKIEYQNLSYKSDHYQETPWVLNSDIVIQNEIVGMISVCYTEERPLIDEGPFLKEERKLIDTISGQLGFYLLHQRLKTVFEKKGPVPEEKKPEWWTILEMLKGTDPELLIRISRKMINYLGWSGIKEVEMLFDYFNPVYEKDSGLFKEVNRPYQAQKKDDLMFVSFEIFKMAEKHLSEKEILNNIHKWIKEDKSGFLVDILENTGSSLVEISNAIERFHHLLPHGLELSEPRKQSFRVALIRRLLSDQPEYINVAKRFIEINDFNELFKKIISIVGSHGKLGGKGAGLFLSKYILKKSTDKIPLLKEIKTPKTWYLTSDGLLNFIKYNNLEDIVEQKYKDIDQIRKEYPYISHVFKNSSFSPEVINGLSLALDDFGKVPLIIRSSSLLEDRFNTAFAGKYKSLFIANQGTKEKRLQELMDAIAEVYASTFGPDPIEYRREQGLLDFHEEMGILIQEVVGKKVGKYFLPAFAGVAFSHNDYRWSGRIKKEDGLVRIVPGLGTRAVDRLSDDYPVLFSPGQPNLRVNVTIDEIVRYSPKKTDVINLETNVFETIDIGTLLKERGADYPAVHQIVSVLAENYIQQPKKLGMDFQKDNHVVTFDGLINNTDFPEQIYSILKVLEEELNGPVDIEFAHDGKNFYLLQCRPLSYGKINQPALIPYDVSEEKIIFSANKFVPDGTISNISHVVYVDPKKYGELEDYEDLRAIGKAVGKLNNILPKRQFVLMGPGRWGSRGDIKLGVSVMYSDISNTSMLIEIARKQKNYVPELSFGTHFFQDLVESRIIYLPLYPDDQGIFFQERFFTGSENILGDLIPDLARFSEVIKVIDVSHTTGGKVLKILMNSNEEKAIALISESTHIVETNISKEKIFENIRENDIHWKWRLDFAENIAANLDPGRFGVKGFYVFGSTKNATARSSSDIDIIIHFQGTPEQRRDLLLWLEGWSLSLDHMNFLRTGYKTTGLLDVHIVTEEDIKKRDSYAIKIGAVTDAARPLPMGTRLKKEK
ncbi:MAG: PEP/pyruvate-binding domain-containing protein [Bacteroidales bacterium]|nr:PEP/pyruvate-binding domain-containing protein [Bacteroidales bacterium]